LKESFQGHQTQRKINSFIQWISSERNKEFAFSIYLDWWCKQIDVSYLL